MVMISFRAVKTLCIWSPSPLWLSAETTNTHTHTTHTPTHTRTFFPQHFEPATVEVWFLVWHGAKKSNIKVKRQGTYKINKKML